MVTLGNPSGPNEISTETVKTYDAAHVDDN